MKKYLLAILIAIIVIPGYASRYALLIGHNDGGESVQPLKYAEQDAQHFADILSQSGGFSESNVELLIHPDSSDIAGALKELKSKISANPANQENLCLLYYSGHADVGGLLLGGNHFSFETLYEVFGTIDVDIRIGIFDACYSGVVTAFKGGARAAPLFFESTPNVKGQVIIASSAANERAQESVSLKSSIFSFHLFNGLRGSADLSGDKKVTLNEAYQYAYRKTVETSALTSGEIQHPVYKFNIQGQGDIVLTNFDQMNGGLLFDKKSNGKYLVLSENYLDVFADFYKKKGNEHFISLNVGKYTVIRAFEKEVGTVSITLSESKIHKIRDNMFRPDLLTESRIKGPLSESKQSATEDFLRESKVSFGVGSGFSLAFGNELEAPYRDATFTLAAQWYLGQKTDFHVDITGFPSARDISVLTALDYVVNRQSRFTFLTGIGAGILYDYKSLGADNVVPLLSLYSGFTATLNPKTIFGFRVPFKIGIDRKPVFHTGIEFRFQIR